MSPRALRTPLPEPTPIDTSVLPSDHDKIIVLTSALNEERRARYYLELAVKDIAENISWGVKLVLATVILAILAGVVVKAVPLQFSSTQDRSGGSSSSSPSSRPPASSSSSSDDQDPPDGVTRHH